MIRKAEEVLLGIKGTMILRTAMIWNDAIKNEFINFNYKKTYPNSLGKTYISLTTTNKIANIIYKGIQEDLSGIYNIASLPITRKELLEKYINFIIKNYNNFEKKYVHTSINDFDNIIITIDSLYKLEIQVQFAIKDKRLQNILIMTAEC